MSEEKIEPAKKKRKRRTRAEMEQAKSEVSEVSAEPVEDKPGEPVKENVTEKKPIPAAGINPSDRVKAEVIAHKCRMDMKYGRVGQYSTSSSVYEVLEVMGCAVNKKCYNQDIIVV